MRSQQSQFQLSATCAARAKRNVLADALFFEQRIARVFALLTTTGIGRNKLCVEVLGKLRPTSSALTEVLTDESEPIS
jgi:hypothetical protein